MDDLKVISRFKTLSVKLLYGHEQKISGIALQLEDEPVHMLDQKLNQKFPLNCSSVCEEQKSAEMSEWNSAEKQHADVDRPSIHFL